MKNRIGFIVFLFIMLSCNKKDENCSIIDVTENDIRSPQWLVHVKDSLDNRYAGRDVRFNVCSVQHQGQEYIVFYNSLSSSFDGTQFFDRCSGAKVKYEYEVGFLYDELCKIFHSGNYVFLFNICFGNCTPPVIVKP